MCQRPDACFRCIPRSKSVCTTHFAQNKHAIHVCIPRSKSVCTMHFTSANTSTLHMYVYLVLKACARPTSAKTSTLYMCMHTSFKKRVHDALRLG